MEKWFLNRSGCWEFFSLSPIFKAAAASPPHLNNTNGEGSFSCSQPENGYSELDSISSSQLLQHPIQGLDHEHHTDFSEAMTTVEKALRRVAQEKASAQAEASEWKRKYQLEKAKKSSPGHDIVSNKEAESELPGEREVAYLNHESDVAVDGAIANGECCRENGICKHEILRDGEVDCKSGLVNGKLKAKRKASFKLAWDSQDENSNQYKHEVISFARGDIVATGRSSKQISLEWETSPQTVLVLTKPNSDPVQILCAEMIRWLTQARNLNIFVEPRVRYELLEKSDYFDFVQTWKDEEEISGLHKKVDLLVTLGGDGTVLWAASLFKGPIPPIVPFALGSLGFMTTFNSETYRESLDSILRGPFSITLRHRLQCCVARCTSKDRYETREKTLVLNEVTIDRGISSFLTNLECYCDDSFMTRVQGDGLILSTTSGSTAYSLAAGGSMVHPQVPGILFTPISPHSLSFRPLILPEYVTLKVQVPEDSRSSAWVSFDGKGRKVLKPGDALLCSMAPWPLPTACEVDSTKDFLRSIHEGLHWNLRKTQSSDGPRDPQVTRSLENGS